MYRIALILLTFLACAGVANSAEFARGTNGYYFKANSTQAYERYTEYDYVAGYYKYDAYACRYVWVPAYYQGRYAYRPLKLDINADDFETLALKVVADRDQIVLRGQTRLQLIDKLGLNANVPNYGVGLFPGYAQSVYANSHQASVYSQTVDVYGKDPNYDLVIQALSRGSDKSSDQIQQIMGGLADFRTTFERVAIARSRDNASVGIAQALAPRSAHVETKVTQFGPARAQAAIDGPAVDARAFLALAGPASCVKCHGAGEHGFDITKYNPATATAEERKRVFDYVTSADDKKRCPKGGPALTDAQVQDLIFARKDGAR